MIKLGG